jgi:hypothetical protein
MPVSENYSISSIDIFWQFWTFSIDEKPLIDVYPTTLTYYNFPRLLLQVPFSGVMVKNRQFNRLNNGKDEMAMVYEDVIRNNIFSGASQTLTYQLSVWKNRD